MCRGESYCKHLFLFHFLSTRNVHTFIFLVSTYPNNILTNPCVSMSTHIMSPGTNKHFYNELPCWRLSTFISGQSIVNTHHISTYKIEIDMLFDEYIDCINLTLRRKVSTWTPLPLCEFLAIFKHSHNISHLFIVWKLRGDIWHILHPIISFIVMSFDRKEGCPCTKHIHACQASGSQEQLVYWKKQQTRTAWNQKQAKTPPRHVLLIDGPYWRS